MFLIDRANEFRAYKKSRTRAWLAKARAAQSPARKAWCLNMAAVSRRSIFTI